MEIRYIKHDGIDFNKWDKLIDESICPLIYGYSWYLDGITGGKWDAMVYGDYQAVFPMPWNKKYGLKYIYQPFFCQQLGLFAKPGFNIPVALFIKAIPSEFILVDLFLNIYLGASLKGRLRKNYQLNLDCSYSEVCQGYNEDVERNLAKLKKLDIEYLLDIPLDKIFEIHRNNWGHLNPGIKEKHYQQFKATCETARKKACLITIGAKLNDQIIGVGLLFKTPRFLFYIMSGKTEEGKKAGIMHGIIDKLIQMYIDTPTTLDFEGSEIEGVAYFYNKFGSKVMPYLHYKKYNFI